MKDLRKTADQPGFLLLQVVNNLYRLKEYQPLLRFHHGCFAWSKRSNDEVDDSEVSPTGELFRVLSSPFKSACDKMVSLLILIPAFLKKEMEVEVGNTVREHLDISTLVPGLKLLHIL